MDLAVARWHKGTKAQRHKGGKRAKARKLGMEHGWDLARARWHKGTKAQRHKGGEARGARQGERGKSEEGRGKRRAGLLWNLVGVR